MDTYGCFAVDKDIQVSSSSGGLFYLLAESCILKGGIVYGVMMGDDCRKCYFSVAEDLQQLKKLQGSKYMQAFMGDVYVDIKFKLEEGRNVFFSGTPCQVNGLIKFLKVSYSNLLCADVVCHGVSSQKVWNAYVDYIETKYKCELKNVIFRYKKGSWSSFGHKIETCQNETFFISKNESEYMQLFFNNISLRPSCYFCYAREHRAADISMADFWGVEKIDADIYSKMGTSLCMIRTDKGRSEFNNIKNNMICKLINYDEAIRFNKAEYQSYSCPQERTGFFLDFYNYPFDKLVDKYIKPSILTRIARTLKKLHLFNYFKNIYNKSIGKIM